VDGSTSWLPLSFAVDTTTFTTGAGLMDTVCGELVAEVAVGVAVGDAVRDADTDSLMLAVSDTVQDGEANTLALADWLQLAEALALYDSLGEGLGELVPLSELEEVEVALSDKDDVGDSEVLVEPLLVTDTLAVLDGDAPKLKLAVGLAVGDVLVEAVVVGEGESLSLTAYAVVEPEGHSYPAAHGPEHDTVSRASIEPYLPTGQGKQLELPTL
jgi:hypothetical protein